MVLAALSAVAAFAALSAVGTRAAFPLHITLGFGKQRLARQFEFIGLGVDADQFDIDLVALFQAGLLHGFEAFVVDLRDVEQGVLAGHDLGWPRWP